MAFLRSVLTIAVSVFAVDGSFKMLATDNACFSATEFLTDYVFHAPAVGEVVGVELEHVSGGVSCSTAWGYTNWGCVVYQTTPSFRVNFLRYNDDGSDSAIFPSSTMEDSTIQSASCPNGHGCSGNFVLSAYSVNSSTIVMKDEANPFTVTTEDTFSLQEREGCCGQSLSDNGGVSCAKVYFLYSTDPTHCATAGCDDQMVCNTETGECETNCDILHIDDFLLDCSVEWDSNTASSTALAASIDTNTVNIATVTASAASNAANIAAIQQVLDRLEDAFGAHSAIGAVDVPTAADLVDDSSWSTMSLSGKDVVMVGMLAVNAVLITSMAVVCCRKQRGLQKYQAVSIASD